MGRDRIHLPGIPRDAARVLIAELEALKDEQARLRRKAGRPGIVTSDYSAKAGEFINVEPRSGTLVTITLPESTPALRGARVTLAFRNSNDVRIVAVQGTVNGEPFVINDRPGTYDATADGLGGWFVQVGVSDEGSGAGGGGGGGGSISYGSPVDVGTANADGVATTVARSDHVHKLNFGSPVAVGAANADGVASTAARSDHVHKAYATGSDDGYLSRKVYVNSSSSQVGSTFGGETIEAVPASWASVSDVPDGGLFHFWGTGSGGGGASGQAIQSTTANGSAGGGGAASWGVWLTRAQVVAALPITFTIPLGGAGGAQVVAGSGVTTGSNFGVSGTPASAGTVWRAGGGGGGRGGNGNRAGGGGGGIMGTGQGGDTSTASTNGGDPGGSVASTENGAFGGAGCNASPTTSSRQALFGGGSGAGGGSSAPAAGGTSVFGCGGGGASGNATGAGSGSAAVSASSDGGAAGGDFSVARGGGGAGTAGSVDSAGSNGSPGATGVACMYGGAGGGAGGSAVRTTASVASPGGTGGAGGFPGGGGGAGGTSVSNGNATKTGGAGGAGGDAVLVITAHA